MAKDKVPTLQSLEKPDSVHDLLREDRGDDCLSCRIVGESHHLHSIPQTHKLTLTLNPQAAAPSSA